MDDAERATHPRSAQLLRAAEEASGRALFLAARSSRARSMRVCDAAAVDAAQGCLDRELNSFLSLKHIFPGVYPQFNSPAD